MEASMSICLNIYVLVAFPLAVATVIALVFKTIVLQSRINRLSNADKPADSAGNWP